MTREEIFGSYEEKYRPINLVRDARTMFSGYVGEHYSAGGAVLFGVNPGGGGDAYVRRTPEDERFYPLLYRLKNADHKDLTSAFEAINEAFVPIVKRWSLWRILAPTLKALRKDLSEVAYMNAIPYRTREDRRPPVVAQAGSWSRIVAPTLELLSPSTIVGLGKSVGTIMRRFNCTSAQVHVVPRTRGDTYVSAEAQLALDAISNSRRA